MNGTEGGLTACRSSGTDHPKDPLGRVPCHGSPPACRPCQGVLALAGEQEGDGQEGVLTVQQPGIVIVLDESGLEPIA